MTEKQRVVLGLAALANVEGRTITASNLAKALNSLGYRTRYKTEYQGKRGTYTLVKAVYYVVLDECGEEMATVVSKAFVNDKGEYVYLP